MWYSLTFRSASYELEYMQYVAQLRASQARQGLSFAAVLLALVKLLLLLEGSPLKWLSCCCFLLILGAGQLAALISAEKTRRGYFFLHYEHINVWLEVCITLCTVWWLTLFAATELMPWHQPLPALFFRGYALVIMEVRVATAIPLLLFEATAFTLLQLTSNPSFSGLMLIAFFVAFGQLVPLALMLYQETHHRWQFIQHRPPDSHSTLGPWPDIIDTFSLAGILWQQLLLQMQRQRVNLLAAVVMIGAVLAAFAAVKLHWFRPTAATCQV